MFEKQFNEEELVAAYMEYKTQAKAAKAMGTTATTVHRALKKYGLARAGSEFCEYCGKPVERVRSARYCSKLCKDLALRKKKGISCNLNVEPFHKVCKACGKEYETRREASVTCSSECAKLYRKSRYNKAYFSPKTCIVCGKEFSPVQVNQLTCSVECRREHRLQSHRERNAKYRDQKEPENARLQFVRVLVAYSNSKIPRTCERCGKPFFSEYATKKYCSEKCRINKIHRDKRIPKTRWIDSDITVKKLYKRDKGKCYLCGEQCDFSDWRVAESGHKYPGDLYPTKDHVIPVSLGGCESWDNVRLAHWKCNLEKSNDVVSVSPMPKKIAYSEKWRPNAKKTAQYSLDGKLLRVWDSTGQIRRELGLNDKHIQAVCRGYKSNTGNAYGYHWEYIDDAAEVS